MFFSSRCTRLAPRVMPRLAQELVARRDLDDAAHVAPRPHRQAHLADVHAEDLAKVIVEPDAIVVRFLAPELEVHDQVEAPAIAHRGHPEQIFDVEDAEPAHLDVMPEQRRRLPEDHPGGRKSQSITSSATRRWPRITSSSAHSLSPMPLLPMRSTPTSNTSTRTP